jgi:hypothetical protein
MKVGQSQFAQQDNDLTVFQALPAHVRSDLASVDSPGLEQRPLRFEDVFVE